MTDSRIPQLRILAAIAALVPSVLTAQEVSARDLVARCARAVAGSRDIAALRTLTLEAVPQGQDHGERWEIIRPNLVRREVTGTFVLLFDGRRAGYLQGPRRPDGTLQGPHLVPSDTYYHFEMDIAIHWPAFFDYPSEYAGLTAVDGSPAHLLRVRLPGGGTVVYAVHAESYLPVRVELPEWNYRRQMGDFRPEGGFVLPHRMWDPSNPSQVEILRGVAVNADLERSRFAFPADVR